LGDRRGAGDREGKLYGVANDAGEGLGDEAVQTGAQPLDREVRGGGDGEEAVSMADTDGIPQPGLVVRAGDL
jgi:hypothetical protein